VRVLIAAATLDAVGGIPVYVRDFAAWLLAQGHSPVVYGTSLGVAAAQIRRLTVPVTDDLSTIGASPDIIHGNSALETMTALLHFPATPAIFTCHGWRGTIARPPHHPRIRHFIAVDDTCADRLRLEEGVPEDKLTVLLNAVDTSKFRQRETPLPSKPGRALVFGNTAHETTQLPIIREACRRSGIEVEVAGSATRAVDAPETVLGAYDLVFAKAKCALEAMACGAAVILCDVVGVGGMVRSENVERLRRLNFGARSLSRPLTADVLSSEIARYDPVDAAVVSEMIRCTADAAELHAQIFALCEDVAANFVPPNDPLAEGRAAAAFLRRIALEEGEQTARLNTVVLATNRILAAPVVGPVLSRAARWLVMRGRRTAS
jgi:hypothetical protein